MGIYTQSLDLHCAPPGTFWEKLLKRYLNEVGRYDLKEKNDGSILLEKNKSRVMKEF